MKKLKTALVAIALVLGVTSAFALQSSFACAQGDPLVLKTGSELFVANGHAAADQTIGNYDPAPAIYSCNATLTPVCTFYLDESGAEPVIRQCEKGQRQ